MSWSTPRTRPANALMTPPWVTTTTSPSGWAPSIRSTAGTTRARRSCAVSAPGAALNIASKSRARRATSSLEATMSSNGTPSHSPMNTSPTSSSGTGSTPAASAKGATVWRHRVKGETYTPAGGRSPSDSCLGATLRRAGSFAGRAGGGERGDVLAPPHAARGQRGDRLRERAPPEVGEDPPLVPAEQRGGLGDPDEGRPDLDGQHGVVAGGLPELGQAPLAGLGAPFPVLAAVDPDVPPPVGLPHHGADLPHGASTLPAAPERERGGNLAAPAPLFRGPVPSGKALPP